MSDRRIRGNKTVTPALSAKLAENARKNTSSPWRRFPHIDNPENHKRHIRWTAKS